MKNLGVMNGWYKNPPKEFTKCRKLKHTVISKEITNHYRELRCSVCNIKYQVDSS